MKKINTVLVALFCMLAIASCQSGDEGEDVVYPVKGHPAYQNQLVLPYTQAIMADSEHPEHFANRAKALINIKCDSLAIIDMKRAVGLDSTNNEYKILLGEWLNNNELPHQALPYFEQVINAEPQLPAFLGQLKSLMLMKNMEAAKEVLVTLLLNAPEHPDVKFLEYEYLMTVDKDTAHVVDLMKTYLKDYPRAFNIQMLLAETEFAVNDPHAVVSFETLFKSDTMDVYPLERIGDFYKNNNDFKNALSFYKKAVTADLNYYYGFYKIGVLYESVDSFEKAFNNYSLAKDINPAYAPAYKGMALIFKRNGQEDSFNVYKNLSLRLDPTISF